MPENKVLVIRGGAIGDFILTLPVLAALRAQFPATRLELLGYPHVAQLAVAGGLADAAHPIEAGALAGFFARNGTLDEMLQAYFCSFAIIVSFLYDPDGIFQENVARCSKAQFLAGPHRPDDACNRHATEVLLKPLERLAIFDTDPVPSLRIDPPFQAEANKTQTIALHPGSGSERKNWPEQCWAGLLRQITAETNHSLLIVGGEAEGVRLQRLAGVVPPERVEVLASQPLVTVASRLQGCQWFVGHDSGITHLAAALGLNVLALWGPTSADVWAPRGRKVRLLRGSTGLEMLTTAQVMAALKAG